MCVAEINNSSLVITPFHLKDLKKLIYIFRLNVPEYFASKEEADFIHYLNSYSGNYFSVRYNGILIGGAGYKIEKEKHAYSISWIFLHPDYTGNGIGSYMVNFLLELFSREEALKVIRVETSQFGYKFFGSFGFSTVKKEKDYWGEGLDLYRMEMQKSINV